MNQKLEFIPVSLIQAGDNDRTIVKDGELEALAESIRVNGLLQPPTLRKLPSGTYEIIAGERRTRACQRLGWEEIPAIVVTVSDQEASALMLTENTSRVNLDPIDEAHAFADRINNEGWSIEQVAQVAGVSTVYVHFRLKLLTLRDDIQFLVRSANLPLGYAQILADGQLDGNRQRIALRTLNENDKPTPAWFRMEVARLATEQQQNAMFSDELLLTTQPIIEKPKKRIDPPLPGKDVPPAVAGDLVERIGAHIEFWKEAASEWEKLGKVFKKQECLAAAAALRALL